ncbi:hypothetical protein [Tuwongella immobilis]|uniref:Uncharacterized protein n=1 Tax=Tuwongella immobilis TaxID=692036 RepID=A0A6C2YPU9_9BACT|nr:hypothetical protein [Tuwongella immobilis]VIP02912.1 Uncharacterized protein OS=Pirellula staleyi (strain ATCC 27377 / DSM 6068 / ICPB 4128) GN=Psta_3808 PE=4 SV=1 [Tuwongella immobilis]VTS02824.1 Uncharacterized protein OS=Pirellula staleyi (strain ATCC 27377 / DSM 6068 / ICPB 4128) GN=Psta_3808 PE=4 SV=1 [Tuwongella immobilis]
MKPIPLDHPLRRLFSGWTEHAFLVHLGVADPPLIDYLSDLLTRFIHMDSLYRRVDRGKHPAEQILGMLDEANALPAGGRTQREVYRHIGDFTLFWTGLFPEAVAQSRSRLTRDLFVSYCQSGKKSYEIASHYVDETCEAESGVLRRLSEQFEVCAYGLSQIRQEWDQLTGQSDSTIRGRIVDLP